MQEIKSNGTYAISKIISNYTQIAQQTFTIQTDTGLKNNTKKFLVIIEIGQLEHADSWLLFPKNIGISLTINEASLYNGELYTIVTNRSKHGKKGALIAVSAGTKAEDAWEVFG